MREARGQLWTYTPSDAICITTNGWLRKDGQAVMGRGCAAEAKQRYPHLPGVLGNMIREFGNHVNYLDFTDDHKPIFAFPVKHRWWEKADLELIRQSAHELVKITDAMNLMHVLLPRPGCGNGQLNWPDVREVIAPILDDRIIVITYA